jgi:hypothetical protein
MVDVEVKTEYKVRRKSGAADEIDNAAADKVKAGAKAMVKKVTDPKRDPQTDITWRRQKKDSINFLFYIYILLYRIMLKKIVAEQTQKFARAYTNKNWRNLCLNRPLS